MPLVEVVSGLSTEAETARLLHELMLSWRKVPVRCGSTPGFIVNRVARPFYGEAFRALSEGVADPDILDALIRDGGGFAMGPLELTDLIGQDVNAAANWAVWSALGHDAWFRPAVVQDELVAGGRLGHKTGRGVYDHSATRAQPIAVAGSPGPTLRVAAVVSDPAMLALCSQLRQAGMKLETDENLQPDLMRLGDAWVAATDGRTALARRTELGVEELVLVDIVAGVQKRSRVGVTSSAGHETDSVRAFAGQLDRAGLVAHYCRDVPGLIVARTVAMLVNLAVDAVAAGVATSSDIGLAMRKGVNYPRDLFEWGDEIGAGRLVAYLDHLEDEHRDGHFRPSSALRQLDRAGAGIVAGLMRTRRPMTQGDEEGSE
jgi:3-hydroxybutyryl-CoA dehydrogenase